MSVTVTRTHHPVVVVDTWAAVVVAAAAAVLLHRHHRLDHVALSVSVDESLRTSSVRPLRGLHAMSLGSSSLVHHSDRALALVRNEPPLVERMSDSVAVLSRPVEVLPSALGSRDQKSMSTMPSLAAGLLVVGSETSTHSTTLVELALRHLVCVVVRWHPSEPPSLRSKRTATVGLGLESSVS